MRKSGFKTPKTIELDDKLDVARAPGKHGPDGVHPAETPVFYAVPGRSCAVVPKRNMITATLSSSLQSQLFCGKMYKPSYCHL